MNLDRKKELFRHLLDLIFFDDCPEIDEDKIIDFYFFLLNSLETRSEIHVAKNDDEFFVVESTIELLSKFHTLDPAILLKISRSHGDFRYELSNRTGLPIEFVEKSVEHMIGDFQDIKQGYLFCG